MIKTTNQERGRTVIAITTPSPRTVLATGFALCILWAAMAAPLLRDGLSSWNLALPWSSAPAASAPTQPAAEQTAAAATTPYSYEADRETIVEMIRDYRLQADEAWRQRLADAIYRESLAASVDPFLVASIVAKESSFSSQAVSHAGAVGLMQLRPFVARDVALSSSIEWNGVETLHSPQRNVRLGIIYYKDLLERFDGDVEIALTAYNYGPTRVSRQLSNGTYRGSSYADEIIRLYETLSGRRAA
jgi:soluble lytic murein transglycosylase